MDRRFGFDVTAGTPPPARAGAREVRVKLVLFVSLSVRLRKPKREDERQTSRPDSSTRTDKGVAIGESPKPQESEHEPARRFANQAAPGLYQLLILGLVLVAVAVSLLLPPWVHTQQYPGTRMTFRFHERSHWLFDPPYRIGSTPPSPPTKWMIGREAENAHKRYLIDYEINRKTQRGVQINWSLLVLQILAIVSIGLVAALIPVAWRRVRKSPMVEWLLVSLRR